MFAADLIVCAVVLLCVCSDPFFLVRLLGCVCADGFCRFIFVLIAVCAWAVMIWCACERMLCIDC